MKDFFAVTKVDETTYTEAMNFWDFSRYFYSMKIHYYGTVMSCDYKIYS